ncbi:metabotropic glutamate receptor 3-like [Mya arenaria]|uniref:metabotropic glutamate receptor 3-like n=1 Tax=Mya arenaria TaxID=6604 RepID=UPI0022DEE144|nr:metabotropic glutamate receptor 3-like [Mya arenaria]
MGVWICPCLLALVVVFVHTDGQTLMNHQTCDLMQGHQTIIQPDADAFISGFFAMHNAGENGVGCGGIRTSEMQAYEAIRWALDRLNKINEDLNGERLDDYYIPGVRLGMVANDYCSNPSMAVTMAEAQFPQFGASEYECQKNTNKLMLGTANL